MKLIVKFFAKEHLFGDLLTILSLIAGIFAISQIKRDIWPKIDFNVTVVTTVLPGASPEQVEKLLINPIENSLKEVSGIKSVFSTSRESLGKVIIELDADAKDPDQTNKDIQKAIDMIEDFPVDAEDPTVIPIDVTNTPIIEVNVSNEKLTEMELRNSSKFIAEELKQIPQVARVVKNGYRDLEYTIEVNLEQMSKKNVSLGQIIQAIRMNNISLPAGKAVTMMGQENNIRTDGQVENKSDLEELVIKSNDVGFFVKLKDIAKVKKQLEPADTIYHSQGLNAINIVISKKSNVDALSLVEKVKEKVKELKNNLSSHFVITTSNDISTYLSNRLSALTSNLFFGLVLVVLVLSLFLPFKVTLVVAIGIPVALFSTLLTAYLLGFSLNLISLIGLIIVLGMLVDDAIVVSENIWRHMEMNENPISAIAEGASEVFAPVLASILTTASAFAPMMFMSGIFGAFVFEIPVMVILALMFSFLEAYLVMPSHFSAWARPSLKSKSKKHWFDSLVRFYARYVNWSLQYRYMVLVVLFLFTALTALLFYKKGRFKLFPPEGVEVLFVNLEAFDGTSLKEMESIVKPIEQEVDKLDKTVLQNYVTAIGIIKQDNLDPQARSGPHYANIRINLTPQSTRTISAETVLKILKEKIGHPKKIEKIDIEFVRQGPPQGRDISLNISGKNFNTLNEIADKITLEIKKINGVRDIKNSFIQGKIEWKVKPINEVVASVGINNSMIAESVRAAFEGILTSTVRTLDEEIAIRVKSNELTGSVIEQLEQVKIGSPSGYLVPLNKISKFESSKSLSQILHKNFNRIINLSASVDSNVNTPLAATKQIKSKVKSILQEYKGYQIDFEGEDKDTKESMQSLLQAFIFAALIIFFLLIAMFKNIFQPLLTLTSIPLGFIGVVYAMLLHDRPLSFMALLGVIALAGVIVNNAIVFIDFVNSRRLNNFRSLNDSIVDAASTRLRPIVLTTLTTVVGLLPTAYGESLKNLTGFGGSDPFIVPIALALGWGLTFGSFLTTLTLPALLRILDDLIELTQKLRGQKNEI